MVVTAVAAFVVIAGSTRSSRSSDGCGGELTEIVRRYEATMLEHDWAALERLLAPDASVHDVDLGLTQDRVGFLAWAKIVAEAYPLAERVAE